MYRLSPTLLESFRLYCQNDWKSLQDFESQLRREPIVPTPAMRLGTAFHAIADGTAELIDGGYRYEDFLFDQTSADDALLKIPAGGVSEVRCQRVLGTAHGPVTLSGRIDRLVGMTPWEIKTKTEALDPEWYANGLQWLSYGWIVQAPSIIYLLVHLKERGERWYVEDADTLTLYTPAEAEVTLRTWTDRMLRHATQRGLLSYLEPKETA